MKRVADDLLEREDARAMRMFKRLTPREREAYKVLAKEISKRFKPKSKPEKKPMLSDKQILSIQVTGFMFALAVLPFMHGLAQALFSAGFMAHFVGDMFRLTKDGVIKWTFLRNFWQKLKSM